MHKLYWHTVRPQLKEILLFLMQKTIFNPFRLVGGTALSLQLGHRLSIDIDLFTDAEYNSINFDKIHAFLKQHFNYVDTTSQIPIAFGKSYYIGIDKNNTVKLDLFYTDKYIQESLIVQGVRMATIAEIIAMKIDVIQRNGRKKDFWDIHRLSNDYSFKTMLNLHNERYPYTHDEKEIIKKMKKCASADDDFEPICLNNKQWPFVKMDIITLVNNYSSKNEKTKTNKE